MKSTVRTIAISTGGGDCPGLNAVIRAATKAAILQHGWKVIGVQDGFDGLIFPERTRELKINDVSGLLPRGGTILGTTNRGNPFRYKTQEDGKEVVHDYSQRAVDNARSLGIDALINIGGDGTQQIGHDLMKLGLNVVGVPKTIDNDLSSTEVSFGFDTALHTVTDAMDRIHTTAESHHRVMVVEVMGRDAGWIALEGGLAGGAHVILIPEIPFQFEHIADFINARTEKGKRFTIVMVAEGVEVPQSVRAKFDEERRSSPRARGVGTLIGDAIARMTHRETRVTVLGHIQRGGSPSPFDRILSTRFGVAAVELIARGHFGKMVCLKGGEVSSVSIGDAVGVQKLVDPKGDMVRTARAIGVCFGDK
jgi:ATP-dependent phosphofructokinase / diphosphate-dependent phosphofructokinase